MQRILDIASRISGHTRLRVSLVALSTAFAAGCASVGTGPSDTASTSVGSEVIAASPARRPAQARGGETTDLWERIRNGFAMPELETTLVGEKERFYLERPEYLQRMFARGGRYLFHIVDEIEKRGMPTELALLPFVESAMNPVALSSAKAAGLWQFIPSTGRAYNLDQNWWVDNRRDVVKSTRAALDYLQKIYEMHGNDWFLALASYNWGEGAVGRAIKRNESRGLPGDYLSLNMPNETRHYVPKLIALKHIVQRASEMGVDLPALPNRPYFASIEKTRPIDLKLAARFAGMTVPEFLQLNPSHNRPVIAASRSNQIRLPIDRVDAFVQAVENHGRSNRAFATWQPYTLKDGDSIESLANRAGVTPAELREANGLRAGVRVLAGTRILSPHQHGADERLVESFEGPRVYELVQRPAVHHTVQRRESLPAIANRYGVSVAQLRELNRLKRPVVAAGTRLLVRPSSTQTMLTTETGSRRVVANTEQPRIMRAVLRTENEDTAAPVAAASSSSRQKSANSRSARNTQAAAAPAADRSRGARAQANSKAQPGRTATTARAQVSTRGATAKSQQASSRATASRADSRSPAPRAEQRTQNSSRKSAASTPSKVRPTTRANDGMMRTTDSSANRRADKRT